MVLFSVIVILWDGQTSMNLELDPYTFKASHAFIFEGSPLKFFLSIMIRFLGLSYFTNVSSKPAVMLINIGKSFDSNVGGR